MSALRVTVCQWPNGPEAIARAWAQLRAHVQTYESHCVLLPEMPFAEWLAQSENFDAGRWVAAVAAHRSWEARLSELGGACVIATRPVDFGNERLEEGFLWEPGWGSRAVHVKTALLDSKGAWEPVWYRPATPDFTAAQLEDTDAEQTHVGLLIGVELRHEDGLRMYASSGVPFLAVPRASSVASADEWLAAGVTAARCAGAFCLSSSRPDALDVSSGPGWIIDPSGTTLALTSEAVPFVTLSLDTTSVKRTRLANRYPQPRSGGMGSICAYDSPQQSASAKARPLGRCAS